MKWAIRKEEKKKHTDFEPRKSVLYIIDKQSEHWIVYVNSMCVNVRKWLRISLMCILMGAQDVKVVFPSVGNGKVQTHTYTFTLTPHPFFAPNFLCSVKILRTKFEIHSQPASQPAIAMNHRTKIRTVSVKSFWSKWWTKGMKDEYYEYEYVCEFVQVCTVCHLVCCTCDAS